MDLSIVKAKVVDDLSLLAKTATVTIAPAQESDVPALEFHLDAESTHATPSSVRPDDQVVELRLGTDGNAANTVFRGLVDYVDDLSEYNGYTGELDMSELSPGRAHKRRVTAVYNDAAALSYAGGVTLDSGFPGGSITAGGGGIGGGSSVKGPNSGWRGVEYAGVSGSTSIGGVGGGRFTAKDVLRDICRKVGLIAGDLNFPDYVINGTLVVEDETAPEVAAKLIEPFNLFPFLQYHVRIQGNVLRVLGIDYTRTGNSDAFVCQNIKSVKRSFYAYEADSQVGVGDIVLTGGVKPSAVDLAYKTVMRDIPLDDPVTTSRDFEAIAYIQELYVEDTVTTRNTASGQLPNPSGGYRPVTDRLTETVAEIGTYILLNGYGADLPAKALDAQTIYEGLVSYADKFAGFSPVQRVTYMSTFYPFESDEQLAQRADEREGQILAMRNKFKTISEGLNKILGTVLPASITGDDVSGVGLSRIPPDAYTLVYTYDEGGAPIDATLEPSVQYGTVLYVNTLSSLGTKLNKTTTTEEERGVRKRKTEAYNTYEIVDVGFDRKLLVLESDRTEYDYEGPGSIEVGKRNTVTKYFYDKYGDMIQKVDEHNTIIRGTLVREDVEVDITPKHNLEYAVREFEDGQRSLAIGERFYELGITQNDLITALNERASKTPSGKGPIPYWSNTLWRREVDVGETTKRNKIRYCMLVNGKPMTDETFYRTAPVKQLFKNNGTALDRLLEQEEALARTQSGIRDASPNEPPSFTPVGFKKAFPLFDFSGLAAANSVIMGQRDLEKLGAYWEETEIVMTLDTTPAVGGAAVARGSSGFITYVKHDYDADSAITTMKVRKLVTQAQVVQR